MTHRTLLSLGLSALVIASTGSMAFAGARGADAAATAAKRATKALAKRDGDAVAYAEAAVAAERANAAYRVLLGRSYIQAGRFQSARDAFVDALKLQPGNGRTALNLALTQIATGDWRAARSTLDGHAGAIAPADRGLAIALAGDPAGAVQLLMAAARQPGADAKLRQNLGLALALSGQWPMARAVAAADMSPADVDRRMEEWATLAQPSGPADQVATLLGVRAVADAGQPVTLALNAPVSVSGATSIPTVVVAAAAPVPVTSAVTETRSASPSITFAPSREVVQTLPVPLLRADGPAKVALAPSAKLAPGKLAATRVARALAPTRGDWVVQLGAFENAAVARDAWSRMSRRYAGFAGQQPRGVPFRSGANDYYRLSVGGYDRASADGICRTVRARGGACFVRRAAGDQLAQWARPKVQIASR